MFNHEQMPESAKTWIYAADRILTDIEKQLIQQKANAFLAEWTAHDIPVKASFDILHDVFLVFMVDETGNNISGCGIDKSVAFIKALTKELNIDCFKRTQIELILNKEIIITDKQGLKQLLDNEEINEDTITFNKSITTKRAFDQSFVIAVSQAWFYNTVKPVITA